MVRGIFERRREECNRIFNGIKEGNATALRNSVIQQNLEISRDIEKIWNCMNREKPDYQTARKWALGLSQRYDINNEPEFEGMAQVFGRMATALSAPDEKKLEDIKQLLSYARSRMYDVRMNGLFTKQYREIYEHERLINKEPEECKEHVLDTTFAAFSKRRPYMKQNPYLKILAFLSALVPLEIPHPAEPDTTMPNPAFRVISVISRLLYFRKLEDAVMYNPDLLSKPYLRIKHAFERYSKEGKTSLHMLSPDERKYILDLAINGTYLDLLEQTLIENDRPLIEKACKPFLYPDPADSGEISDEKLTVILSNSLRILIYLSRRTDTNIEGARDWNNESLKFFSHIRTPASPDTIIQKLRNIKIALSGTAPHVSDALQFTNHLITQIETILKVRKRASEPYIPGSRRQTLPNAPFKGQSSN